MRTRALIPVVFFVLPLVSAPPDPRDIVRRSIAASQADWISRGQYSFVERDEERELSTGGSGKISTVKTYEVTTINGARYRRLIARNDQPLAPEEEKKEQHKLEKAKAKAICEPEEERRRRAEGEEIDLLFREMLDAFDFKLAGERRYGRIPVYVVELTPRPGYRPPSEKAKVLTKLHGTLWINKQGLEWVRAEAEIVDPVNVYAFLGRLQPGTRIEFEQVKIDADTWLPKRLRLRLGAKILMVKARNTLLDRTFDKYRKVQS